MDDTAEIKAQLDRIGALASGGAGSRTLLEEMRRLLEEGERAVRAAPAAKRPSDSGPRKGASRAPRVPEAGSPRAGEEAAVT